MVMTSGLVPHLISLLTPDPEFGMGAAIECAWCLHYIVSRYGVGFFPLIFKSNKPYWTPFFLLLRYYHELYTYFHVLLPPTNESTDSFWKFHVTVCFCSTADTSTLITEGLLSQCNNLLITLGGAVAKGSTNDGVELVSLFETT